MSLPLLSSLTKSTTPRGHMPTEIYSANLTFVRLKIEELSEEKDPMGIVQVKIKNEGPTGSSTSVSEERKKSPFRLEWQYRNTCFTVIKTKLILEVLLRKSPLPKNNMQQNNVKCIPNFQTGMDLQFQNPKPISPTSFN